MDFSKCVFTAGSLLILLTCFDFRHQVSADQSSSTEEEAPGVKEDGEGEILPEWEESWEGHEDCIVSTAHLAMKSCFYTVCYVI